MRRRPTDRTQLSAVLLSIVLAVSIAGAVAFLPAAAEHPDDAPDYTGQAYFEISEVSQSDHYPGEDQGSMQYFAGGEDAFAEQGAEEGVWIDYIIIDAYYDGENWIDYTDCNTENTAAFGLDRGNDNEGTNYDEDLVQKQKQADFRDDGITVEFYNHDDFGNDPPYMAPEDAIVAEQGENSAGGGCLSMTEEAGWYRMQGFMNGTVADNGDSEPPSEDAEQVSVSLDSTWFYVCECDSEEEAREQLGAPPGEEGSSGDGDGEADGESTPAEDGEGDEPGADEEGTPAADGEGEGDGTPAADGEGEAGNESGAGEEGETGNESGAGEEGETGNESGAGDGEAGDESEPGDESGTGDETAGENESDQVGGDEAPAGDEDTTPTADDAPGFGALVAIVALLGSALLLNRRR